MFARHLWAFIVVNTSVTLHRAEIRCGHLSGVDFMDAPQPNPEIAVPLTSRKHAVRRLWCAQPLLLECPAETNTDFARTESRDPCTGTARLATHRQWQQLLFQFHRCMERSRINHHRRECHRATGDDYHDPDFVSRYRSDFCAHSCQYFRRPRMQQRR